MSAPPGIPVHLKALDVSVSIRAHGADAAALKDALQVAWSRCLSAPDEGARRIDLILGPSSSNQDAAAELPDAFAASDLDAVLEVASSLVTLAALEQRKGELVMLHSCAVADRDSGRTLAMVGASGAGKTTAASTLAQRFGYVTDEAVGVQADLNVVRYPKPLSLLESSGPPKKQISPDALGLAQAPENLRLHGVLLLDRRNSPTEVELTSLDTLAAMAELAPQSSYLSELVQPLHRLSDVLAAGPGVHRVTYYDSSQLVGVVDGLLNR